MRAINAYALMLFEGKANGAIPISWDEARKRNEEKWDIYWTFNEFSEFGKRTKQDLKKIWALHCEIDSDNEKLVLKKLELNLSPSLVVKTKNGFHLYWYLEHPIDCSLDPVKWADWFYSFVKERILPVYGADPQACDVTRLLRAPFYKYWKQQRDGTKSDGNFFIDIVFDNEETKYTLEQLEEYFPLKTQIDIAKTEIKTNNNSNDFWSRANNLPAKESLEKLSGTEFVNFEKISFKKQKDITRIVIGLNPSNAWIDKGGKIGSTAGAGPAIPNWINFYHRDWKKVASILKTVFPELESK